MVDDAQRLPQGSAVAASPADAIALGRAIGRVLEDGDVLGLTGPLGAGKTQLAHGLVDGVFTARGASTTGVRVCSPSYTIVNTYERGSARVHHMDLYRLASVDDLESTGYWDLIDELDAVSLVEWMGNIPEAAPEHGWTELVLDVVAAERPDVSARSVGVRDHGAPEVVDRIQAVLRAWTARS